MANNMSNPNMPMMNGGINNGMKGGDFKGGMNPNGWNPNGGNMYNGGMNGGMNGNYGGPNNGMNGGNMGWGMNSGMNGNNMGGWNSNQSNMNPNMNGYNNPNSMTPQKGGKNDGKPTLNADAQEFTPSKIAFPSAAPGGASTPADRKLSKGSNTHTPHRKGSHPGARTPTRTPHNGHNAHIKGENDKGRTSRSNTPKIVVDSSYQLQGGRKQSKIVDGFPVPPAPITPASGRNGRTHYEYFSLKFYAVLC